MNDGSIPSISSAEKAKTSVWLRMRPIKLTLKLSARSAPIFTVLLDISSYWLFSSIPPFGLGLAKSVGLPWKFSIYISFLALFSADAFFFLTVVSLPVAYDWNSLEPLGNMP